MKREIQFVKRQYKWGWSLWIQIDGRKVLLADKLKNEEDVKRFIDTLPYVKVG